MKLDWGESGPKYETIIILSLVTLACFLTYYFHFVLKTGIIFTHFYYIPIILSAIWWKRKGLWVPFFLAGVLFFTDYINPIKADPWVDDFFRALIFISVSVITVILSERLEKSHLMIENSEERFRSVVESAIDGIITTDMSGNVVFVNESFHNIFGYSEDDILGKHVKKFMPPRYREKFVNQLKHFQKTGEHRLIGRTFESVGLRKDGTEFPFEMSITIWEVGNEQFTTSILRDITYRKGAEKTRAILSAIIENSDDAIIGQDVNGNILSWNKGAEMIYGYKASEVIGKSISIIYLPKSDEQRQIWDTINRGERIDHYETKRVTKKGDIIDIFLTVSAIKDSNGDLTGVSSIARDITREKKAEKALAESEAQLTLVTANMADVICQASVDGSYIYVSPSVKSVLGYEPMEMIGKSMFEFVHPGDLDAVKSCMQDAVGKCMTQSVQYRYIRADGSYVWLGTIGTPLFNKKGEINGFVCNSRDITHQKNAEDALRESEEKFRTLIESAKDPISVVDENGIIYLINKAGAHELNMEPPDLLGSSLWDVFPETAEKQIKLVRKVFKTGEGLEVVMPVQYDKFERWYSTSLQPLWGPGNKVQNVQIIARDITDLKGTQMKLEQALYDKDMLMKEIYHRVKNNLMVISSLLNLQSHYIKDEAAKGIFKESQDRAHSMALIHERLYRSTDLKHMDFGDYIRTLSMDLFRTYVSDPSRINLEMEVEDIMIDINTAIPLGLIVNELLSNSMKHAFPGDKSGVIKVKFNKDGDNCILEVSDTGVGFPPELQLDKTDSLGLQLVNNLISQINGELKLKRSPGTTFCIIFKEKKVI